MAKTVGSTGARRRERQRKGEGTRQEKERGERMESKPGRGRQATRLAGQALENRSFALGAENLTELTLLPNQTFRQL